MRLVSILIAAALATGCSGPTHEISARGFSTAIQNQALARTTAENRAIASLQEMLAPDAVSFTLKRAGPASLLTVHQPEAKASYQRVEFRPLVEGWMAIAFAERPPDVAETMAKLPAVEVSATVTARVLEMAAKVAKNRALRQLIDQAADAGDGVFEGTVTLVSVEHEFDTEARPEEAVAKEPPEQEPTEEGDDSVDGGSAEDDAEADTETETEAENDTESQADGEANTEAEVEPEPEPEPEPFHQVTVTIRGLAKVERTGEPSDDDRIAVIRKAAIEHFHVGEWRESADVTSTLLELTPQSLPFILLKAAAQFHLDEPGPATETLSLAIMEGGGPEAEPLTSAFAELTKTVGDRNVTALTAALEEQKTAAAEAAEKSKKKKKKRKRKK